MEPHDRSSDNRDGCGDHATASVGRDIDSQIANVPSIYELSPGTALSLQQMTFGPPVGRGNEPVERTEEEARLTNEVQQLMGKGGLYLELFVRFARENPSVQLVRPCKQWMSYALKWMTIPAGLYGEHERRRLRSQIREVFPLLPEHLEAKIAEHDGLLRLLENHEYPQHPHPLATQTVQGFYAATRWLDLLTPTPMPPVEAALTPGQLAIYMTRLSDYLREQASELRERKCEQRDGVDVDLLGLKGEIVQSLRELSATDINTRRTAEEVVRKANPGSDVGTYKKPLAELVEANVLRVKTGRGGGYWLNIKHKAFRSQS